MLSPSIDGVGGGGYAPQLVIAARFEHPSAQWIIPTLSRGQGQEAATTVAE